MIESPIIPMVFAFFVGLAMGIMFWGWVTAKEHPHERVDTQLDGIRPD
jgi:hypothetical protein